MFEENLIREVEKYPCIYDKGNAYFRNKTVKDLAWEEIALSVEATVDQCQGRWKTLRDRYVKEVRAASKWRFRHAMEFMRAYVAEKHKITLNGDKHNAYEEINLVSDVEDNSVEISFKTSASLKDSFEFHNVNDEESIAPTTPKRCKTDLILTPTPTEDNTATNSLLNYAVDQSLCYRTAESDRATTTSINSSRMLNEENHEIVNKLLKSISVIVDNKYCSNNDAFFKFLDSFLIKVDDETQDAIKVELVNIACKRVTEALAKNRNR